MNRCKPLFTIRPVGRTVWTFCAVAINGVLIVATAAAPSQAADAIFLDGFGGAHVQNEIIIEGGGTFLGGAILEAVNRNESSPPVNGVGTFSASFGGPLSHPNPDYSGYTSNITTSFNGTTVVDPAGNLLSIFGNATAHAQAAKPNQLIPFPGFYSTTAITGGGSSGSFNWIFQISRSGYEYEIVATTSASTSGDNPFHDVDGSGLVTFGDLFNSEHIDFGSSGTLVRQSGSPTGLLPPGRHQFAAAARASSIVRNGLVVGGISAANVSANASANWNLTLTPPIFWTNPGDGVFQTGGNWSGGSPPTIGENATIDLPGNHTITLQGDVEHKRLHANGNGVNVTLDVNSFDYVLDEIHIGGTAGDNVSVTFQDSSGPVSISSAAAGSGIPPGAAASHATPAQLRADLLKAGEGGKANVDIPISTTTGKIENGGSVRVQTSNGIWQVHTLDVAQGGLILSAGGALSSDVATLAPNTANVTLVTLSSLGTFWKSRELVVGKRGNGTLQIANNGTLFGNLIVVGEEFGSTGTIDLLGGAKIDQKENESMTVGFGGRGFLTMTDSTVDTGGLEIGFAANSDGEVKVGSNSTLRIIGTSTTPLHVGVFGRGRLVIEGSGRVTTENGGTVVGAFGKIEVLDGHFHDRKTLVVNGELALSRTNGSASLGANSVQSPGRFTIGPGGRLLGHGTIRGKVKVTGGQNQFGGTVLPGLSPGTLTIDGDYEQDGGLLGIEIAGTAPGQFDVLAVTGNATLGGNLLLEFIDGFAPRAGDEFEFLDVDGALSGTFANIQLRGLLPGFQFELRPDAGGLAMIALNDGVLVPEPATLVMLFAGVLATVCRRSGVAAGAVPFN